MSQIKLFRIASDNAQEVAAAASNLEKPLQKLIEDNLQPSLGVRLLATAYSTGKPLIRYAYLGLAGHASS